MTPVPVQGRHFPMNAYEREDPERWRRIFGDDFELARDIIRTLTANPTLRRLDLVLVLDVQPSKLDRVLMHMVEHGILDRTPERPE